MLEQAPNYKVPDYFVSKISAIIEGIDSIADIPFTKIANLRPELSKALDISLLSNDVLNTGIVYFDFDIDKNTSFQKNILISSSMFHLVNLLFFKPNGPDSTPFDTYKSSTKNSTEMKEAGIKFYTPDEKLGYHNDVCISKNQYHIPRYVSLLNLFIGYKKTGNFYFINHDMWDKFDELFYKAKELRFKFKPTPMVYENSLFKKSKQPDWSHVPVFWQNQQGDKYAFYNGEMLSSDDNLILDEFQQTLMKNKTRLAVPQKLNRIIVFRNDKGFHSRDIFEEQQILDGTTRLFLRAISDTSESIPV